MLSYDQVIKIIFWFYICYQSAVFFFFFSRNMIRQHDERLGFILDRIPPPPKKKNWKSFEIYIYFSSFYYSKHRHIPHITLYSSKLVRYWTRQYIFMLNIIFILLSPWKKYKQIDKKIYIPHISNLYKFSPKMDMYNLLYYICLYVSLYFHISVYIKQI